jgi:hypothetical protein
VEVRAPVGKPSAFDAASRDPDVPDDGAILSASCPTRHFMTTLSSFLRSLGDYATFFASCGRVADQSRGAEHGQWEEIK